MDTSRRLLGVPRWSHEGSSRTREAPVADPALIRGLAVGQAAYIYGGGVTFVQVKRLLATPAALPRPPMQTSEDRAGAAPAVGRDDTADQPLTGIPSAAAALLDEAFGAEPGITGAVTKGRDGLAAETVPPP
jgi:hypothetical protein